MHTTRTRTAVALVATVTVLAGACGGSAEEPAVGTAQPVELSETPTEWAGDLQHLVVDADPSVLAAAAAPVTEGLADHEGDGSASSLDVQLTSGRITREVPHGLALIYPETTEQAAVAGSLPEPFVLGIDAAGHLWGWAPDGRILDPGPPPVAVSAPPSSEPDTETSAATEATTTSTVVGAVPAEDAAFVALLEQSGLFAAIRPMGGGRAAVATGVTVDAVAELVGVAAVAPASSAYR